MLRNIITHRTFNYLSLGLIPFAIFIILWGAWVRISGSGDGCGVHWPLCQGGFFPSGEYLKIAQTWIEYFHRAKSGLFGILVTIQLIFAYYLYSKNSAIRFFALGTFIFTVIEGLLGAALVLGGFVSDNESIGRVIIMSFHLVNTLVLLFFLVGTFFYSLSYFRRNQDFKLSELSFFNKESIKIAYALIMICLIAVTGAWAALSSTLYPSSSLTEGILNDLNKNSPFLLQLRVYHPMLSVIGAFVVYLLTVKFLSGIKVAYSRIVYFLLTIQILLGATTILLLSPTTMKLTHLLTADLLWISLVWVYFLSIVKKINQN